jgi:SpoVK/Ycf46/Vps4 family AAA+-type ATPase
MTSTAARTVRHADEFKERLTVVSDAAIGVILIRTREPYRCQEVLQDWAVEMEMDFRVWTILTGWQQFPQPLANADEAIDITIPVSSDKVLDINKAFSAVSDGFPEDGCFIAMNCQYAFENPAFQQHIKAHVQRALSKRQRIILLCPEGAEMPSAIEDDIYVLDFKAPSHIELRGLWENMTSNVEDACKPDFDEDDVDLIVQNSLGMTGLEFETALAMAFVELRGRMSGDEEPPVEPQDFIHIIMRSKIEVIKRTDLLELMPEAKMDEVGGLDLIKEWLELRKLGYTDEAKEYGIEPPKGVLVVGPPGSGKSVFAKAAAGVLGVPLIKFDIGKVFGKFVGDSEANMRKALALVEAMAPCSLLVDEIDKGFGGVGGSNDGGTTMRVFGTFLTWMQERQQTQTPIFVIATANNVQGLPPELLRKGRFDEIFAVTFPGPSERAQIVKIHLEKRGHNLPDADIRKVAEATPEYVGAELEAIVLETLYRSLAKKLKAPSIEIMLDEARQIVPVSRAFPEKVKHMNEWAKNNAKPASRAMAVAWEPEKPEPGSPAAKTIVRKPLVRKVTPSRRLDN